MTIPFLDLKRDYQELKPELDAAYRRVMDAGSFVLGPEVEQFEHEFAAYCESKHCVTVANCLDALTLLLRAFDIGPGDEVIVPGHTFIATWLAVSAVGATPVAADVDPTTYNLDPDLVASAITPQTRALIPVHLYGVPADLDPLMKLARPRGIKVFEDSAQAHGARYKGRRAGSLGDAAAFSFYPVKNLGGFGDGGAITTNDALVAEKVRLLRNYGSRTKYQHELPGVNSRLDELQAAFLRVKLRHLDSWNARRARLAAIYHRKLQVAGEVSLPIVPSWADPVCHLYVIRHPRRDELQERLRDAGIGSMIHYPIPPHQSRAYESGGWRGGPLPVAERLAREVLSIPMHPHLSEFDVERVAASIQRLGTVSARKAA